MRSNRGGRIALLTIFLTVTVVGLAVFWTVGGSVFGNRLELPAEPREVVVNEIRLFVPAGWFYAETPNGEGGDMDIIAMATPHGSQTTWIAVIHDGERKQVNLDDLAKWGLGRLEDKTNLELITEGAVRYSQTDVFVRDYSWTRGRVLQESVPMKCRAVYALTKDTNVGYGLEMCGATSDWRQLEDVFSQTVERFAETLP